MVNIFPRWIRRPILNCALAQHLAQRGDAIQCGAVSAKEHMVPKRWRPRAPAAERKIFS